MKNLLLLSIALVVFAMSKSSAQIKTIHVYVALCDNEHQGIVPVPKAIGNGKDARNNLYWGAGYGVKTFFSKKESEWKLVKTIKTDSPVLERLLYKHKTNNVYLLADAYDGERIKTCVEDFLKASNNQNTLTIEHDSLSLDFGGSAALLAYVGHDGLMDFSVNINYSLPAEKPRDVIILLQ